MRQQEYSFWGKFKKSRGPGDFASHLFAFSGQEDLTKGGIRLVWERPLMASVFYSHKEK